jgi:hypothetical protein
MAPTRAHDIRAGFDDRPVVVFDRQGAKLARAC